MPILKARVATNIKGYRANLCDSGKVNLCHPDLYGVQFTYAPVFIGEHFKNVSYALLLNGTRRPCAAELAVSRRYVCKPGGVELEQ